MLTRRIIPMSTHPRANRRYHKYAQFLMHQQLQFRRTVTCTMFVLHLCVTDGWILSCLLSCVVRAETPPASFQRAKLIFASIPTKGAPDTAAADG